MEFLVLPMIGWVVWILILLTTFLRRANAYLRWKMDVAMADDLQAHLDDNVEPE